MAKTAWKVLEKKTTSFVTILNQLPVIIYNLIHEAAAAVQCDPALAFAAFLGIISAAVVGRFVVQPSRTHSYIEPAQLYIIMRADSGERKNSIIRKLIKPLSNKLNLLRTQRDLANSRIQLEQDLIENEDPESLQKVIETRRHVKKLEGRKEPRTEKIIRNFTLQSMPREQERTNGKFIFINGDCDALSVLSGELYAGKEGTTDQDSFLNSFDNEPVSVTRVGKDIELPMGSASFLIGAQPNRLVDFMSKNAGRGTHERFIYILAKGLNGKRKCFTDDISPEVYNDYCARIEKLSERNRSTDGKLETISFSSEAEEAYSKFFETTEKRLDEHGDLSDERIIGWANRIRNITVRIAGLLALYLDEKAVSLNTWKIAETFTLEYLIPCGKEVFGVDLVSPTARKIATYLSGGQTISQAALYGKLHNLSGMNKNIFRQGIAELEQEGLVRMHEQKRDGNVGRIPSPMIEVHPDIKNIFY